MKSFLTKSSPASSGEKIKISKREVERMIEVEVQNAMKKKERTMDNLIDRIQRQLEEENSLKTLQNRMMMAAEKAEKACTYLNEAQTPPFRSPILPQTPPLADSTEQSQLEIKNVKTPSESMVSLEGNDLAHFMETTRKQIERLSAENEAMKVAMTEMQRATPSPTSRRASGQVIVQGLSKLMKKEPMDTAEDVYSTATASSVKRPKEDVMSPESIRCTKRIKSEPVDLPLPPTLPGPTHLPSQASLYNLPQRQSVRLALIKNPTPQVSVVWSTCEEDSRAPPMNNYTVFFALERDLGSGIFEPWQKLPEIEASRNPITAIKQYQPGLKICVTVVGKDIFGRYGPFSEVECAGV